jgi:hypothetical protein
VWAQRQQLALAGGRPREEHRAAGGESRRPAVGEAARRRWLWDEHAADCEGELQAAGARSAVGGAAHGRRPGEQCAASVGEQRPASGGWRARGRRR